MYAVFAQASGMFPAFHIPYTDAVYNHKLSVWFDTQFQTLDFAHLIQHGPYTSGYFVVVQSNTQIPASEVKKKMGRLFQ